MSIVFVVSGPSGTGKSTLVNAVVDRDQQLEFAISVTTRPRRQTEVNGKSYHFVSVERFTQMRNDHELLEFAEVFGNYYGTPRAALDDALARGRDVVLDIDVQGASLLSKELPDAVRIFILPPSKEILRSQLTRRASDSIKVIERRLGEATREVQDFVSCDYVIVNRNIDDSVNALHAVIVAERSRRARMDASVEPILKSFGVYRNSGVEEVE